MSQTKNLQLNLFELHQIHKELLFNENIFILDAFTVGGILAKKIPPENANFGDKYIIPDQDHDEWKEKKDYLAVKLEEEWLFVQPKIGMHFWLEEKQNFVVYSQGEWRDIKTTLA